MIAAFTFNILHGISPGLNIARAYQRPQKWLVGLILPMEYELTLKVTTAPV